MSDEKKNVLSTWAMPIICMALMAIMMMVCMSRPQQASGVSESTEIDTVTVSGKAEVKVVPDKASISAGVELHTASSEQANEQLKKRTDAIISALKGKGVDEKDISTDYYSVSPDYTWDDNNNRIPTGYEGSASIEVSGIGIDDVSTIIDLVTASGADYVGDISYYSSTYKESYDEALAEAIAEARDKADNMGAKAGFKVVRVHDMQEGYQNDYTRYVTNSSKVAYDSVAMEAESSISPGTVSVEARVSVVYVIE